jgi:hypothetical protein
MVARWSVSPFGMLWPTMDAAFEPDDPLQHDIAGTLGNGSWGYIVGTYDKDAGPRQPTSLSERHPRRADGGDGPALLRRRVIVIAAD